MKYSHNTIQFCHIYNWIFQLCEIWMDIENWNVWTIHHFLLYLCTDAVFDASFHMEIPRVWMEKKLNLWILKRDICTREDLKQSFDVWYTTIFQNVSNFFSNETVIHKNLLWVVWRDFDHSKKFPHSFLVFWKHFSLSYVGSRKFVLCRT